MIFLYIYLNLFYLKQAFLYFFMKLNFLKIYYFKFII